MNTTTHDRSTGQPLTAEQQVMRSLHRIGFTEGLDYVASLQAAHQTAQQLDALGYDPERIAAHYRQTVATITERNRIQ